MDTQTFYIAIPRLLGSSGHVLYQTSWALAKSYMASRQLVGISIEQQKYNESTNCRIDRTTSCRQAYLGTNHCAHQLLHSLTDRMLQLVIPIKFMTILN